MIIYVIWENLPFYIKYSDKRQILEIGRKPDCFGSKIPSKREYKHYQTLQKVKNPIHEAKKYQQVYELPSMHTYAQVAKHFGVSRARVCQMLNLLKLPEDLIEYISGLEDQEELKEFTERRLRTIAKRAAKSKTI